MASIKAGWLNELYALLQLDPNDAMKEHALVESLLMTARQE